MSTDGKVLHEWNLSSNLKVRTTVGTYRGRLVLDIRKHFEATDGAFLPTKRGISLEFCSENLAELAKAVRAAKAEITKDNRSDRAIGGDI